MFLGLKPDGQTDSVRVPGPLGFMRRLLFRNINHVIVIIINFVQTPYFKMYVCSRYTVGVLYFCTFQK